MIEETGVAAGSVWDFLSKEGEATFAKLVDGTGLGKNEAHRAIGWLAREGKIEMERRGRTEIYRLS